MQARGLIGQLEARPERAALATDADRLIALVKDKRPGDDVAALATRLRWAIIKAYGVEVAPKRPPDLAQAGALYAAQCALCHGAEGQGDGAAGKSLDPPPANFHDGERMAQRSVYSLYSTITLGVGGTGMTSFRGLTDEQRWALAFYVANLGQADGDTRRGAELWQAARGKQAFPDLASIVTQSAREVHAQHGADAATVLGYLRQHPDVLVPQGGSAIARSAALLRESVKAYRQGRGRDAQELAAASYLDGFELAEASLDAVDRGLRGEVETQMMRYRGLLRADAPLPDVLAQAAVIEGLLDRARGLLDSTRLSASATFLSAFVILLREGLEAILVVAAIYALLVRAGRRDALAYLHGGWILALIAGGLTWLVASYVIAMSGATREVTEGVSALVAAAILLYVGFWMHGKSQSRQWQAYLDRRLEGALAGRTLWALAFVSFLAVYREAFETVLFYEALAVQAGPRGGVPLLAGLAAAAGALLAARLAHRPRQRAAALRPLLRRQRRAARAALRHPRGQGRGRAPGGRMDCRSRGALPEPAAPRPLSEPPEPLAAGRPRRRHRGRLRLRAPRRGARLVTPGTCPPRVSLWTTRLLTRYRRIASAFCSIVFRI